MPAINLKKNILLGGSFRIIVTALSFCISWISARFLGVEMKGEYSYIMTLGGFIWMTLDLGLQQSYPFLARKYPERLSNLYGWTIFSTVLMTVVLLALGLGLRSFWSQLLGYTFSPTLLLLFVLYVTLTMAFLQTQSFYIGLDRVLNHSLASLVNSGICLMLLSLGFLLVSGNARISYMLGATIIALAGGLAYLVLNYGKPKLRELDFKFVRFSYSFGIRAFISALIISLLIRADIVIVKHFLGFREVGIYSIAAHIVDFLQIASNMAGGLLLAKLSDTNDVESKWLIMKKMLMAFGVFLVLGNLGFLVLGKLLLSVFYGAGFVPSYGVYLWLIPASFGLSFGSLFNNYLNSKGFPIATIVIAALALALNIGLNILLIPAMGITGAALATSISYMFWFILIIGFEQRQSGGKLLKHIIPTGADWHELIDVFKGTLAQAGQRFKRKAG